MFLFDFSISFVSASLRLQYQFSSNFVEKITQHMLFVNTSLKNQTKFKFKSTGQYVSLCVRLKGNHKSFNNTSDIM